MKTRYVLAIAFCLIISTTSHASAISPDAPQDGKQYTIKGIVLNQYSMLLKKWTTSYSGQYPGVKTKYDLVGAGNVAFQYSKKYPSFGVTDVSLPSIQFKAKPQPVIIPVAVEAVAVVYNIPGLQSGLKLTGPELADIYLGNIIFWDNSKIQESNPGIKLPHARITAIHRTDAAGTTYVFTSYLSAISDNWKNLVGKGTSVTWKAGTQPAQSGETWIVRQVANSPYSISYLDLGTAITNKLNYAAIENADKTNFVVPSLEGSTQAASSATLPEALGDWSNTSIVNSHGRNSYPISSLVLVLTYQDLNKISADQDTAKALVHQIYWDVTDGQKLLGPLKIAPLPDNIVELDKRGLGKINFKGSQLFAYDGFVVKPE
ncbi:MAG: phosphate ABC transporter substrate-binding protein PstS [Nitrososphaera sp.]